MKTRGSSSILSLAVLLMGAAAFAQDAVMKADKVSATVDALNARIQEEKGAWTAGKTPMSDLSDDDFKSRLIKPEDVSASVNQAQAIAKLPLAADITALSSSFDWRSKGIETPVRDQGHCGACWAFSLAGAEESQLLIKKPGAYSKPGAEVARSVQALVSCDTQMKGCDGGNLDAKYLVNSGLPAESAYPYKSGDGKTRSCGDGAVDPNWKAKTESITDWGIVDDNVESIKKALAQYGPVPTTLMVFDDFKNYKSGVYTQTRGSKFLGGHAVLIVGYDDADQSLIVKNSWTTGWGDKGYFKIAYSEVTCSLTDLLIWHKHVNFGCITIGYNMKKGFSAEDQPVASEGAVKKAMDLISTPLP
jgi:C1A family cysteine protease